MADYALIEDRRECMARLRRNRLMRKIGLREMARRLEMAPGNLQRAEVGKVDAGLELISRYAEQIGMVATVYLLHLPTPEPPERRHATE